LLPLVLVPLVAFGSPQQTPDRSPEGEKTPSQREAAIARLVKQLGSADFREREAATKSLTAIGLPALDALRKAATDADPEVARGAPRLVESLENSLEQLLADYRGYGLPLPPADAKLVRFDPGVSYPVNGKPMPPTYFVGFLVQPGKMGENGVG